MTPSVVGVKPTTSVPKRTSTSPFYAVASSRIRSTRSCGMARANMTSVWSASLVKSMCRIWWAVARLPQPHVRDAVLLGQQPLEDVPLARDLQRSGQDEGRPRVWVELGLALDNHVANAGPSQSQRHRQAHRAGADDGYRRLIGVSSDCRPCAVEPERVLIDRLLPAQRWPTRRGRRARLPRSIRRPRCGGRRRRCRAGRAR